MLVLEYKITAKQAQYKAIDEALRTVHLSSNKAIRYWIDAPRDAKINRFALNKYSTRFLRKAEFDIKHSQRRIYKKVKGSSGRRKARARYSRKHLRVNRQRTEHAKRLARHVCKSNDLVAYEELRVANMLKNHNLALSIADASWYQFRQWLEHFATKFGKVAIAVPPHYTS